MTSLFSFSQENEAETAIITDRPDATESAYTVGLGNFQLETGGIYQTNHDNGINEKNYTLNTSLLRYGLSQNFELRLGWDYVYNTIQAQPNIDDSLKGFNPFLIGFKTDITNENGLIPQIALLGHLYLPFTASNDFKPDSTGIEFIFSFDHTLTNNSGFSYNLGAGIEPGTNEISYLYTMAYGYDITDSIGFYAELYGNFPENSSAVHNWDAGFTYLPNNNLQFDLTVGTGISSNATDLLFSTGLSYRFLKK